MDTSAKNSVPERKGGGSRRSLGAGWRVLAGLLAIIAYVTIPIAYARHGWSAWWDLLLTGLVAVWLSWAAITGRKLTWLEQWNEKVQHR